MSLFDFDSLVGTVRVVMMKEGGTGGWPGDYAVEVGFLDFGRWLSGIEGLLYRCLF